VILTSTSVTFTREEDDANQSEIKQLRAENERLRESAFIIAVYRGFQSAIGSGETYLSFPDGRWRIDWKSPRVRGHGPFAGRFEFDADVGVLEMQRGEDVGRHWAEMFRDQLRQLQSSG
jgi:hypothetical protein